MSQPLPPADECRSTSRTGIGSLLLSLVFHALLALLLYCFVFTVTKQQSIFLTGSTASGERNVSVEIAVPMASENAVANSPAKSTDVEQSNAAIDALIAQALQANALARASQPSFEQPSVEFFGTKAFGSEFVFVLDISFSMNARRGERFRRACDELLRAVSQLNPGQSYYVFLFCWNLDEMFFDRNIEFVKVSKGHEQKLRKWIYNVNLGPGTDPRRALSLAHRLNPDAVFLLSDGEFNQPLTPLSESGWLDEQGKRNDLGVQEGVERIYTDIPIHTIAFENPFAKTAMGNISERTGGEFRYVMTDSLKPIDSERFLRSLKQIDQKHRHETDPARQYQTRLSLARELISDGELLYAEYIIRPLRRAPASKIMNPALLEEVITILNSEVGKARLEDFEQPPELQSILAQEVSEAW